MPIDIYSFNTKSGSRDMGQMTDLPVPTLIKHPTCSLETRIVHTQEVHWGGADSLAHLRNMPCEWFRTCLTFGEKETIPGVHPNEPAISPMVPHCKWRKEGRPFFLEFWVPTELTNTLVQEQNSHEYKWHLPQNIEIILGQLKCVFGITFFFFPFNLNDMCL